MAKIATVTGGDLAATVAAFSDGDGLDALRLLSEVAAEQLQRVQSRVLGIALETATRGSTFSLLLR
jgi:threonine synthase